MFFGECMSWPLRQKWFWVLFGFFVVLLVLPFLVAYVLISLPPWLLMLALIVIILLWAVVKGYRDYVSKR
jgi:hypothetical protein